jgi:hypothetical protein
MEVLVEYRIHRNRRRLIVTLAAAVVLVAAVAYAGYQAQESPSRWPPQFPREGATKVFENDKVIVWEQVWPSNVYMHKHVRDIITIALEGGPIRVITPEGKETTSPNFGAKPGFAGYFKAGLGPHAELAADPKRVPRAIFIEMKGTEPQDCGTWSSACR